MVRWEWWLFEVYWLKKYRHQTDLVFPNYFALVLPFPLLPITSYFKRPDIFEPKSFYFFLFTVWRNNLCCNDDRDQGVILSVAKVIGFRFLQMLWNCSAVYNVPFIFLINVSWVCSWLACHFFLTSQKFRGIFSHIEGGILCYSSFLFFCLLLQTIRLWNVESKHT